MSNRVPHCLTTDVFSSNEIGRFILSNLVNRQNIRMVERGGGACFLFEAAQVRATGGEFFRQNLQRNRTSKLSIFSQIHVPHTAASDKRRDVVSAYNGAGCDRHRAHTSTA